MVESRSVSMMAFRHGFLVSVLCLIFLLNIHSTALKFVPVFYKSMHLPIVQFSWHGLGSSDYTKQGYFSARAWVYEHWSFDIWIWLNCGVPRDSRLWSGTNCLALATMDSIWSSSHRCKERHKRRRYYKTPVLITATPLRRKGYWSWVVIFLWTRAQYKQRHQAPRSQNKKQIPSEK